MRDLQGRVRRLESASTGHGPLLLSWRFGEAQLLKTSYAGGQYCQAACESRDEFLSRVQAAEPSAAVLWIDERDEAL